MTNLEKLTKLLCENKEVEKDIMELRFWCYLKHPDGVIYRITWKRKLFTSDEIIWNPIQDHHLRMYCLSLKLGFNLFEDWKVWLYSPEGKYSLYFEPKPLHEQCEEVLGKIYDFLIN